MQRLFYKKEFKKDFIIILLREKIGSKKELSKMVAARDKHGQGYGVIPG
jgi:hypothetical protein